MGLGPAKMRTGDHVYILLGGKTPFILRNSSHRAGLNLGLSDHAAMDRPDLEVIGDCYLHGLMDGEAMGEWRKVASERLKGAANLENMYFKWIMESSNLTVCE